MGRAILSFGGCLVLAAGTASGLRGPLQPPRVPVETFQIGKSGQGRVLSVWRLGKPEPDDLGRGPDQRPALLIIAGLDGRHDFGSRVALSLIDRIATEHAELLDSTTIYVVPDLNPDNDALFDRPGTPKADFGRAPRSADADGDARADEDPADDLNGDGLITMMRVKDPRPDSGLAPTLVLDPDDPRILRAPDPAKGEVADYALLIEGIDNDGDGRFNEDGFAGAAGGGVDLDRNFASLWPEHREGAGRYQLSEPETRSLVEWLMTRDNIVCALAYTPGDNILNAPDAGKYAQDGREPTGIEEGDKSAYAKVQEAFKEVTRQTGAPKGEWEGSFTQWAYAQFGVWSFATPAWVRPDLVKSDEAQQDDQPGPDGANNGGVAEGPDPGAERRALQARGVPGFIVEFFLATPEQRAVTMEEFGTLSQQEQADRMAAVSALPEDLQLRMRALISGAPDPGAANAGIATQPEAQPSGGRAGGRTGGGRGTRGGSQSAPGGTPAQGATPDADEAKWIKYSDDHLGGRGFVEWQPFEHPQLGPVEIGGLVPGIRHEPPESEWSRIADEQGEFVARLLALMPRLDVTVRSVERVAPGVWRVRVRGSNPGELPTRSAIGEKARRIPPIVVSLGADVDDILAGQRAVRWDTIPGHGAFVEAEWLVKAPDGASLAVEVRSTVFGDRTIQTELKEGE